MKLYNIICDNPHCEYEFNPSFSGLQCQFCNKTFCDSCAEDDIVFCETCGIKSCTDCVKKDKETGFYFCGETCKKEFE